MAREHQSVTIDGHEYVVQMLGGSDSWKMLLKLSKMVGPGIGKLFSGGGATLDSEIGAEFISAAIESFVENVDEPGAEHIINKLKEVTTVNGTPMKQIFELHFQGDAVGVVKWLIFALKAQFGNFSDALSNENGAVPVPLKAAKA